MPGLFLHNSAARRSTMEDMTRDFPRVGGTFATPFLVPAGMPDFPRRFQDLKRPPQSLWVRGRLPAAGETMLAIVGSRATRKASCDRVASLAASLARSGAKSGAKSGVRSGCAILSGGALGIDAAAHRGALASGGATFAVLGCGIDIVYPDRHAALFDQIVTSGGGLLSEYGPGVQPRHGQFPARNRLVAALADAILVGECRLGSGALITARLGWQLGRPLLALPGSAGTDQLLASGLATEVDDAADVRAALAGTPRVSPAAAPGPDDSDAFNSMKQALVLLGGVATAEGLALKLQRPLGEVLGVLTDAELNGRVMRLPGGRFEVPRGN
jgi:DNA processing protein